MTLNLPQQTWTTSTANLNKIITVDNQLKSYTGIAYMATVTIKKLEQHGKHN